MSLTSSPGASASPQAAASRLQWTIEADLMLLQQIKIVAMSSPSQSQSSTASKASGQAAAKQLEQIDWKRVAQGLNMAMARPRRSSQQHHQRSHRTTLDLDGQTKSLTNGTGLGQVDEQMKAPNGTTSTLNVAKPTNIDGMTTSNCGQGFGRVDGADCIARINTLLNRIQKHRTIQELVYLAESSALQKVCASAGQNASFSKEDVPYLWFYEDAAREDYVERHSARKTRATSGSSNDFHSNMNQHLDPKIILQYATKWDEFNPMKKLKKIFKFCKRSNIHFGQSIRSHVNMPIYPNRYPNAYMIPSQIQFSEDSITNNNHHHPTTGITAQSSMIYQEHNKLQNHPNNHATPLAQHLINQQQNHHLSTQTHGNKDFVSHPKKKVKLLLNEPKKPANNPYSLFTKNTLMKIRDQDINGKEKLSKVAELWRECTDSEKQKLKEDVSKIQDQYLEQLAKFYSTLTDENDISDFKMRHEDKMNKWPFV